MTIAGSDFAGRVTFVTGPDRGSGKTSFLNYALGLLRAEGEKPAFLGIGLDGEASKDEGAGRPVLVPCRSGELFLTAERYLAESGCRPEIVGALPGSGALAASRWRGPAARAAPSWSGPTATTGRPWRSP